MSSAQPPDAPHTRTEPASSSAGRLGVVLTNLGKVIGIAFGTLEAIGPARPAAVLFWVALFLGSQALEDLLTRFIDRAMGK